MELYIIRHGQSVNNAIMEDQKLRVQDPELTEVGHQQADYTAKFLSTATNLEQIVRHPADSPKREAPHRHDITHLYCSAMHRAMQTARPIGEALNLNPSIWLEIHEHGGIYLDDDNGVPVGYGGMTRTEIQTAFPNYILPEAITDSGWYKPESGFEDLSLCQARAVRVKQALMERAALEESQNDSVAIVSHGTFIDALLKAFLNNLPGEQYFYWHYNTGISRLDILPNRQVIIRYINRVTHLPAELVT
ncbi:MAG: histidine phosphatase family protein [Anaerolineae bacterium]